MVNAELASVAFLEHNSIPLDANVNADDGHEVPTEDDVSRISLMLMKDRGTTSRTRPTTL